MVIVCESTSGKTQTNNVNTLTAGGVLFSGTGVTTAFGRPTSTGTVAKTTARAENAKLLDGPIVADVVTAVAKDTFRNGERFSSKLGTQFLGLEVAGAAIPVDAAPDTRIELPGIGYVVLNEQKLPASGSTARTQVNGLYVFVKQSNTTAVRF